MGRSTTITPTRTQTKTINTTITTPTETEEGDTQKEYEALMSDRAQKRAAEYGDEFGNDEDLLVSQESFFDKLSPSSSENNIDVAGDVGKGDVQATLQAALRAALAGDVGKEVGCLEQNAGWLEQHYKEETEEILDSLGNQHTIPAGVMRAASELLASGSSPLPIKRQRIPLTMPLQIVDVGHLPVATQTAAAG